jgi:hypothetical protein
MRIRIVLKEPRTWAGGKCSSKYMFIETKPISPGSVVSIQSLSIEEMASDERLDIIEKYTSGKLFKAVSVKPTRNHNGTVDLIET